MANIAYRVRSIVSSANLNVSAGVTSIDDPFNAPPTNTLQTNDNLWFVYNGTLGANTPSSFRGNFLVDENFIFNAPLLRPGNGLQLFRVWVRKNNTGGSNVGFTITVYDNDVSTGTSAAFTLTDTSGNYFQLAWDSSILIQENGNLAGIDITQTTGTTGNAANRRYLEIGAIEWYADVQTLETYRPYNQLILL